MPFTGNENQSITLSQGTTMTQAYRNTVAAGSTLGHYFAKTIISSILAQTNCVGIRIYYALDSTGAQQLVICGVDANENDLYTGVLADKSYKCPPSCGTASPLNS